MKTKTLISICICTFKRPKMLKNLLLTINNLETQDQFYYEVIIVDNDSEKSALPIINDLKNKTKYKITYDNLTVKNIAKVRNQNISLAKGDYIAFIDDDEYPVKEWLLKLYKSMINSDASAVLGPVLPEFKENPPKWLIKSGLCERKRFPTGTCVKWNNTRTGNVLLKKTIFHEKENFFDPTFGILGGEDIDFFRRLSKKGHQFIWNNEASVYEFIPLNRTKFKYFIHRSFMRGYISFHYFKNEEISFRRTKVVIKAIAAISIYSLIMPFFLIFRFPLFLQYLIKSTDHFSRLLTALGLLSFKERKI